MSDWKVADLFTEKIEKIPVPLLVIGLGGTGCDAVLAIKETFATHFPAHGTDESGKKLPPFGTAYLVFDSEPQVPNGLDRSEYMDISFPKLGQILDNHSLLTLDEMDWVDPRLKNFTDSPSTRQAARLMLSRNYTKVKDALKRALVTILQQSSGSIPPVTCQRIEIVIVTGIGGNTGSGIFLDMAQIIRRIVKDTTVYPYRITGYVVMPDVSLARTWYQCHSQIMHNGFTALKELDFWMRIREHKTPYTIKYSVAEEPIKWDQPPFDDCYLLCLPNGSDGINEYKTVCCTIAEQLLHYMVKDIYDQNRWEHCTYNGFLDWLSSYPNGTSDLLNCRYRSIGVCTHIIPKKQMLYYEGKLLLSTFMPERNDAGLPIPSDALLTDGKNEQRAADIAGDYQAWATTFLNNHSDLPNECTLDVRNHIKVNNVRDLCPTPHDPNRWLKWRDQACTPAARSVAEIYVEAAWERFAKFADDIITDPDLGPFALKLYLEDANGLMKELYNTLASWREAERKLFADTLKTKQRDCDNLWPQFVHPPLLGKTGAQQSYVDSLKSLYKTACNGELIKHLVTALEKVILRIGEYLEDGLKPLCEALYELETTFSCEESPDPLSSDLIFPFSDAQPRIDELFAKSNADLSLTKRFLNALSYVSQKHEDTVEYDTSGWKFTCRCDGMEILSSELRGLLDQEYSKINGQTLDDILFSCDSSAKHSWVTRLEMENNIRALPLYQQKLSGCIEPIRQLFHHLSVPYDFPGSDRFSTDWIKPSFVKDRISCVAILNGIPLSSYLLIDELSRQYYDDMKKPEYTGMHLVSSGREHSSYRNDWSLLPLPNTDLLFAPDGPASEKQRYEKIKGMTDRALRCGMIEVDSGSYTCGIVIKVKYINDSNRVLLPGSELTAFLDEVQKEADPSAVNSLSLIDAVAKIREYLDSFDRIKYREEMDTIDKLSKMCGMQGQPIDPWDSNIRNDPALLEKAKANRRTLCETMASVCLYRNPALAEAVEEQLCSYEQLAQYIKECEASQ